MFCGLAVITLLLSFFVASYFFKKIEKRKENTTLEQPVSNPKKLQVWYKNQRPPPKLVITPDLPIFPDKAQETLDTKENPLAYEEALPREIYEPKIKNDNSNFFPGPKIKGKRSSQYSSLQNKEMPRTISSILPNWRKFSVSAEIIQDKPMIAIVIDDMGIDKKRSADAIELRAPLTLSFLTYATNLERQTEMARLNGHELMLHVSMEPGSDKIDPGPNALLTSLDEKELRRRLNWGFGRFSKYVGINNHMGSKFTSNVKLMRIVIEEIKRRGLLFLDSRTSGKTVGAKLARELGVPVVERNIFLDHENDKDAVNTQLALVEKIARRSGAVIAIGHPRDATIKALRDWLKDVESRGFQLVPITSIVSKYGLPSL